MDPIDASLSFPEDVLPPEGIYTSREEVYTAINAWAASRGYAFVTGRSRTTKNGRSEVVFACDRGAGRKPSASAKRIRETTSRRTGCLFSVTAKESLCKTIWTLRHRPDAQYSKHNHEPSISPLAHPAHRQLSSADGATVKQLARVGIQAKGIRSFLRLESDTLATQQDIYNYIAQGKRELAKGQSNMHALAEQLESEGFWSRIRLDETSRVTSVLFAHPQSLGYVKSYPEVLLLDCT